MAYYSVVHVVHVAQVVQVVLVADQAPASTQRLPELIGPHSAASL